MWSNAGNEAAMFDCCLCNVNKSLHHKTALSVNVDNVASIATETHGDLYRDWQLQATVQQHNEHQIKSHT